MTKNNSSKMEVSPVNIDNKRTFDVSNCDTKTLSGLEADALPSRDKKVASNLGVKTLSKSEKFKDSTSLLKSYRELEREYTKKCQELSKFRKLGERVILSKDESPSVSQILAKASNLERENPDSKVKVLDEPVSEPFEGMEEESEKSSFDPNPSKIPTLENLQNDINFDSKSLKNDENMRIFEKDGWKERVFEFFESHPDSKKFAREIAKTLQSDGGISKLDNALEIAYAIAKSKNSKEPESLLEDESFVLNNILKNPKIKSQIIAEYVDENSMRKTAPPLGGATGGIMLSSRRKISSLEDARRHLLGLLEK